jgi:RimJ/RimL family protein N-acetyltransferase
VPLRATDAEEMAALLGDERLHEFIGGSPPTLAELRDRYTALAAGSPDTNVVWLNWIVRRGADSQAVGTVQATLEDGGRTAHVAWVIGGDHQNQGFASEAAAALVDWLRQQGVSKVVAHIHPGHQASAIVAGRAGLLPTDEYGDGEQIWLR